MGDAEALLLTEGAELSTAGKSLARMLEFFGVTWKILPSALGLDRIAQSPECGCRLFAPADQFLRLIEELERRPESAGLWRRVHSAFVYASTERETLDRLVSRVCAGGRLARRSGRGRVAVAEGAEEFCGIMSGVQCYAAAPADTPVLESLGAACSLVSLAEGAVFVKAEHQGVPVYISTIADVVDVDREVGLRNFDVREHFFASVPPVLYIKSAFRDVSWQAPGTSACLVIDDPLLRRAYGCIEFSALLAAMERHRFSSSIAFIPWNWRRSRPDAVQLFRDNPHRFSLAVHGCDHTGGEFGATDAVVLQAKATLALERMRWHQSATGIHHDEVMVFPQGVFSVAAMAALKCSNYVAAVNTEIASVDASRTMLKVSDVWDVAVTRYGFPLFTRRYPHDGVANFAFDALLGKPIIIVIHHDFCGDGGVELAAFVERLNALKTAITWRSLGELVRRSYRWRAAGPAAAVAPCASPSDEVGRDTPAVDVVDVEMYGNELRLENSGAGRMRFRVSKREADPSSVTAVYAGPQSIPWDTRRGRLQYEVDVEAGDARLLRVQFDVRTRVIHRPAPLRQRVKTGLRRYLSEARDNYIVPGKIRLAGALRSARDHVGRN
jgi:hypothetical protein